MNDLEYLARNVHEWPRGPIKTEDGTLIGAMCKINEGVIGLSYGGVSDYITRAQWQAERDRISWKPSWNDAPEWATYLSQNSKGHWFFHEHKPFEYDYAFCTKSSIDQVHSGSGEVLGGWRDTLEQKPVDATTNKCDDTENSEDNEMEQVTLHPGDYCDVSDTTPEQRKAIADAFVWAGAVKSGSYPYDSHMYLLICWDHRDNKTFGTKHAYKDVHARLLTIDQVLNATNAVCTDVDPVVLANVKAFNEAPREALVNEYSRDKLMIFDPSTGEDRPYPSHATQYRKYHGNTAWLFNPFTGNKRDPRDIGSDVLGLLILE